MNVAALRSTDTAESQSNHIALHTDVSLPIYSPTALVPSLYMRFAQLRGANPRVRLAFTELGERGLVTLAELGAAPETSDYDDEN